MYGLLCTLGDECYRLAAELRVCESAARRTELLRLIRNTLDIAAHSMAGDLEDYRRGLRKKAADEKHAKKVRRELAKMRRDGCLKCPDR